MIEKDAGVGVASAAHGGGWRGVEASPLHLLERGRPGQVEGLVKRSIWFLVFVLKKIILYTPNKMNDLSVKAMYLPNKRKIQNVNSVKKGES